MSLKGQWVNDSKFSEQIAFSGDYFCIFTERDHFLIVAIYLNKIEVLKLVYFILTLSFFSFHGLFKVTILVD